MKYIKYICILGLCLYLIFSQDRYTKFRAALETPNVVGLGWSGSGNHEPEKVIFWPSPDVRGAILSHINSAKTRVYLSVYMLTDETIIESIALAHKRWVDTRVLLEPSVYNLPKVNQKAVNILRKSWVTVLFSSEQVFNFNHSKYFVIDDRAMIATGNMTKSSLLINREVSAWYNSPDVVSSLVELFLADSQHIPVRSVWAGLLIAPLNTRSKLSEFINWAKIKLVLMSESFSDEGLTKLLLNARERGVSVEICVPQNRPIESSILASLKSAGVIFSVALWPHVHAKTLLRDSTELFFGSANFTANSLDNNREVSAFTEKQEVILRYKKIIESDCKS